MRLQILTGHNVRKNYTNSPAKQQGIALWHVLLLVVIAITLTLCAKRGTVPFFQKEAPIIGKLNVPNMPSIPGFSNRGGTQQNTTAPQAQTAEYEPQDIQPPRTRVSRESPVNENNSESLMVNGDNNHTAQVTPPPPKNTSYEVQYPRDLASGYYTVQVFSGYNSKSAYDLQNALKRDGYRAYIHTHETNQGILFKVRIGEYRNRSDAFAMKSQIRRSYPKKMGKSFVLLRQ